jgi:hypothetical protein
MLYMEKLKTKTLDFSGLKKSIVAMLLMGIFVGLGEKMAERFLPLYLIALGGTPILVGLLNGLDNLLSALYSYPGVCWRKSLATKRLCWFSTCWRSWVIWW